MAALSVRFILEQNRQTVGRDFLITEQETAYATTLRVLLVEDQPIIAMATASRLRKTGYHVSVSHSGEHALTLLEDALAAGDPYRLVLMDIDLGAGIDGVETARRAVERFEVPIVFLTSHTETEYVNRVREVTRYGYVLKSSGDLILRLSMEMAVDLFRANQLTRRQERELDAIYEHAPITMFVVDPETRVVKANRRARETGGLTADEASDTTMGRVMECVRAVADPQACGRFPECAPCGLRALVSETLESGAEFSCIPVTLDGCLSDGDSPRTLMVSTAPIEREDGPYALVSVIDLDALTKKRDDGVRNEQG